MSISDRIERNVVTAVFCAAESPAPTSSGDGWSGRRVKLTAA